jgi:hypothetical protein
MFAPVTQDSDQQMSSTPPEAAATIDSACKSLIRCLHSAQLPDAGLLVGLVGNLVSLCDEMVDLK